MSWQDGSAAPAGGAPPHVSSETIGTDETLLAFLGKKLRTFCAPTSGIGFFLVE